MALIYVKSELIDTNPDTRLKKSGAPNQKLARRIIL